MPGITLLPRIGHHGKSLKSSSSSSSSSHQDIDLERGEIRPVKRRSSSRVSFGSGNSSRLSFRNHVDPFLSMTIESPPLVMYGPPKESSGALLSGLVHLNVEEEEQKFDSIVLTLQMEVARKRPAHGGCADCAKSVELLMTWKFVLEPVTLSKGVHSYPFSHLFPGSLPASNDNALSRISYALLAAATTFDGDEISFRRPIKLERAVLPGPDKNSIRIFPPTSLSAAMTFPSIVHPGGDFVFDIRLDGVLSRPTNTRWKLRKATWRIEEHSKILTSPCKHHTAKFSPTSHEDARIIGSGELKRGWKSDFETSEGKIELEVHAGIPAYAEAACKQDSTTSGISVAHILIVEMIVVEEYSTSQYARVSTPTGAARVLRMQFHLIVTARSGMGISWDEEAPPTYEDVPLAPPRYPAGEPRPVYQYANFPVLDEVALEEV